QHQDLGPGTDGADVTETGETVEPGQLGLDHRDVGTEPLDGLTERIAVRGRGDNPEILLRLAQAAQAREDQGVVIGENDANQLRHVGGRPGCDGFEHSPRLSRSSQRSKPCPERAESSITSMPGRTLRSADKACSRSKPTASARSILVTSAR